MTKSRITNFIIVTVSLENNNTFVYYNNTTEMV